MWRSSLLRKRPLNLAFVIISATLILAHLYLTKEWHFTIGSNPQAWKAASINNFQADIAFRTIQNSTLGFQKILVRGLDDRFDKKDVWSLANIASDLQIEWISGVRGEDISLKARPSGWGAPLNLPFRLQTANSTLGSFRGHMNAVRKIIDERLATAPVLEDDVEWDVMIRQQLEEFVKGVRYILSAGDQASSSSPYGDEWDLLLLGHCSASSRSKSDERYWVVRDDPTVTPASQFTWAISTESLTPNTSPVELRGTFTRVIYRQAKSRCAYAYALSLNGAKKLLYYYTVEPNARMMDFVLSDFCSLPKISAKCVTTFPPLFDQYLPAGPTVKDSDRRDIEQEVKMREHGVSTNIVFLRKAGLQQYIDSETTYGSQWPNDTLWPKINTVKDKLPTGLGYFLTKDKFDIEAATHSV